MDKNEKICICTIWTCMGIQKKAFLIGPGTFSSRQGQIYMDMTVSNKAMQAMGPFVIQFNKNRWKPKFPSSMMSELRDLWDVIFQLCTWKD